MSAAKHSPGPWTLGKESKSTQPVQLLGINIVSPCGHVLAHVSADPGNGYGVSDEETRANAHLFAAAPELRASCVASEELDKHTADCTACVDASCPEAVRLNDHAVRLRGAALAKARVAP